MIFFQFCKFTYSGTVDSVESNMPSSSVQNKVRIKLQVHYKFQFPLYHPEKPFPILKAKNFSVSVNSKKMLDGTFLFHTASYSTLTNPTIFISETALIPRRFQISSPENHFTTIHRETPLSRGSFEPLLIQKARDVGISINL